MLLRTTGAVALLLLAGVSGLHAQAPVTADSLRTGWQFQTVSNGFDKPASRLLVKSTDGNAAMEFACGDDSVPSVGIVVGGPRVFLFFGDYFVSVDARFLPDSTIVSTSWKSLAAAGHGDVILADEVLDHPDYAARIGKGEKNAMAEGLLTRLRRADTLQAQLLFYGQTSLVVRFPIQNHDVLEHFLSSKCVVTPEK